MRFLLDTCTFLWLLLDAPRLSGRVRQVFQDPANEVFLSAVSAWEIGVKYAAGRLELPQSPERFIPYWRQRHGIASLSLDEEAALHVPRLPMIHSDPFDRMLICQAIIHGLPILTPDPHIAQYPIRVVW